MMTIRIGWNGDTSYGGGSATDWMAKGDVTNRQGQEEDRETVKEAGDPGFMSMYTPPVWDSTACMGSWGLGKLQTGLDPAGGSKRERARRTK